MKSEELEVLISRYDDGDLSEKQRRQVETALKSDPQAARLLEQYRRLNKQLAQLPEEMHRVDFALFSRRVRRALDSTEVTIQGAGANRWGLWVSLAAAAVIVVVVSVWLNRLQPTGPEPRGQLPVSVVSVDQRALPAGASATAVKVNHADGIPDRPAVIHVTLATKIGNGVAVKEPTQLEGKPPSKILWCAAAPRKVPVPAAKAVDEDLFFMFF